MKQLQVIFLIVYFSSFALGQSEIYNEISTSNNHTILTEFIDLTDIDEILNDGNYYSFFAPNDDAFLTAYDSIGIDSLKINAPEFIRKYLLQSIVPDTIEIGSNDEYLPLYGNTIRQFIDASGNIIVGASSSIPYPYLDYSEPLIEFENGRILWVYNNILNLSTDSLHQAVYPPIYQILQTTGLQDSIKENDSLLTMIVPIGIGFYDYLDANFADINVNSPFLDSLMRRHIIDGFYPFQEIEDGLTVSTWSDELLRFTIEEGKYFVNGEEIGRHEVKSDGVILLTQEGLLPSTISNIITPESTTFDLFPNPSNTEILIQTSGTDFPANINIYTIQGQDIIKTKAQSKLTKIDISHLNPGLYLVEYNFENSKQISKLVVH